MKPCIQDQVKQFINNFVNLRMDLSNNNGPTVEYTIVKTENGWNSSNVKDWILENLSLDVSKWISIFEKEEKNSSGHFLTERLIDDHWVFANKEKIGLRYWDSVNRQYVYEENGSIFPVCREYYNMQGLVIGDTNTRSPKSFLMGRDKLISYYDRLNTGEYYVNQDGIITSKPSDMTTKEFLSEYSTSLINPNIEFGSPFYQYHDLISSVVHAFKDEDGDTAYKALNLAETFTKGLFNDSDTLWGIIDLHSRMQGRVPICNSIWGIGSVNDTSDAEWDEEIPTSSTSSSTDKDLMGGKGQSIVQVSKIPGRYPNDKNNSAESGQDTKVYYSRGHLARKTTSTFVGDFHSLNEKMHGGSTSGNLIRIIDDPGLFGMAILSQTQIFAEAVKIFMLCEDDFLKKAVRISDQVHGSFYKHFFPWYASEKGEGWVRVPLSKDASQRKNPTKDEVVGAFRFALGTHRTGSFGEYSNDEAYYNALYPDGYNGSYNNVQKVISYWSEHGRYYFLNKFMDEYNRTRYGFPYGNTVSHSNGKSKKYVALQIFGSQEVNQGQKQWITEEGGNIMWIDGETKFKDSPFWRFSSNTSDSDSLGREQTEAGANESMNKIMGDIATIQIPNKQTDRYDAQQLLFVDMGAETVPTFEDILHKYKDTVWFETDKLKNDGYHKISLNGGFGKFGVGHFNGALTDALSGLHGSMTAWARAQAGKEIEKRVYWSGWKETDLSKVNMSGSLEEDSNEEKQKEFINPRIRNHRIVRSNSVMNCTHPINMDYQLFNINSEWDSSNSNSLVLTEDGWEQASILTAITQDQCPNFSINRKSFSLKNELYSLNSKDIKSLESINFSVQGGTLNVDYSFSNAQIIPDYQSLIGARFAFNKIVR